MAFINKVPTKNGVRSYVKFTEAEEADVIRAVVDLFKTSLTKRDEDILSKEIVGRYIDEGSDLTYDVFINLWKMIERRIDIEPIKFEWNDQCMRGPKSFGALAVQRRQQILNRCIDAEQAIQRQENGLPPWEGEPVFPEVAEDDDVWVMETRTTTTIKKQKAGG